MTRMVTIWWWVIPLLFACENRLASPPKGDLPDRDEITDQVPFDDGVLLLDETENPDGAFISDEEKENIIPEEGNDGEPSLDEEEEDEGFSGDNMPEFEENPESIFDDDWGKEDSPVVDEGTAVKDDAVISDDTEVADDASLPDLDVILDVCQKDEDCGFGYRCDTATEPHECLFTSTCTNDYDCSIYETCQVVGNWKECQFDLSESCQSDADCQPGERCETIFLTFKACRSFNECASDAECAATEACIWNGSFYECVTVCQKDSDCGFGYRCVSATPHNLCEYANECASDADCPAFYACEPSGNWNVCRFSSGGGICTSDANCAPDEYCDLSVGFLGTCKSRSQCTIDPDCGENMVCQFNGTYNECVPKNPTQCLFDFQCPEGWSCVENVCKPQYAGVCTEIEGMWHVVMSSVLFFENGAAYEFIPQGGCSGSIKKEGDLTGSGVFSQNAPGKYTLTMMLIFTCSADITLNTLMNVTCANGTATLVRY